MSDKMLFDDWPEWYENWFTTPIGRLVKQTETDLIREMLDVRPGEKLLDAGCGTGIFTLDFLSEGAIVTGLDISMPMVALAENKLSDYPFSAVRGDILYLPFKDNSFDKTVSVTALEFIENGEGAIGELLRVTRPGGLVVVATLNSLSPWAARRKARPHHHLLENAFYRSPDDLLACTGLDGAAKTCVHFLQNDDPEKAVKTEQAGLIGKLDTGAFVAACWRKPV